MIKDIENRQDIERLVDSFYAQVRQDALIGPIFNRHIGDHWATHLPKIYGFWEAVLLGTVGYSGNLIQQHIAIDRQYGLSEEKFARWLNLWQRNLDARFSGPNADNARAKAGMMAQLMQLKITDAGKNGFIQ